MSNFLKKSVDYVDFISNNKLTTNLDDIPYMTQELKEELASYDIYSSYQLVGKFAQFHFDHKICSKLFIHVSEKLLSVLFQKLVKMGFHISLDGFVEKINVYKPEEETLSEDDYNILLEYYRGHSYI